MCKHIRMKRPADTLNEVHGLQSSLPKENFLYEGRYRIHNFHKIAAGACETNNPIKDVSTGSKIFSAPAL
jgi:hypothetical protein